MRKALNENPAVQAGVVVVLLVLFAFILFTRVLGAGGGEEAAAPAETAAAPATGAAPEVSTDPAAAPAAIDAGPGVEPSPAPPTELGFEAGPGLPKAVVEAYNEGKTVVLLVIREHPQGCYTRDPGAERGCAGIDDKKLAAIVQALRDRPATEVFVTHAYGLARYSRIALGVDADRAPALIVLRPKRLSKGSLPAATVRYGFRGPASVLQAVKDAEYEGRANLSYHP